jgi:hypothetical protein
MKLYIYNAIPPVAPARPTALRLRLRLSVCVHNACGCDASRMIFPTEIKDLALGFN